MGGWVPSTMIDVISDGARGMRSLVTSVAPRVSPRILDRFHVSMKLHAIRSSICGTTICLKDTKSSSLFLSHAHWHRIGFGVVLDALYSLNALRGSAHGLDCRS